MNTAFYFPSSSSPLDKLQSNKTATGLREPDRAPASARLSDLPAFNHQPRPRNNTSALRTAKHLKLYQPLIFG